MTRDTILLAGCAVLFLAMHAIPEADAGVAKVSEPRVEVPALSPAEPPRIVFSDNPRDPRWRVEGMERLEGVWTNGPVRQREGVCATTSICELP